MKNFDRVKSLVRSLNYEELNAALVQLEIAIAGSNKNLVDRGLDRLLNIAYSMNASALIEELLGLSVQELMDTEVEVEVDEDIDEDNGDGEETPDVHDIFEDPAKDPEEPTVDEDPITEDTEDTEDTTDEDPVTEDTEEVEDTEEA